MPLYRVTYTPAAKIEALARKRGWNEADGTSLWDHVPDGECVETACLNTDFRTAVLSARVASGGDVCGAARVEEIVRVHWRGAPPSWETVATWEICTEEDPASFSADQPHWRDELSLQDGDEVLA